MKSKSNFTDVKCSILLAVLFFLILLCLTAFKLYPKGITSEIDPDDRELLNSIFANSVDSVLFAESKPKTPFEGGSFDAFLLVCNASLEDELRTGWKEMTRFNQHKGTKPGWFTRAMVYQDIRWEKELTIDGRKILVACFFNKNKSDLNTKPFLFTYVCISPSIL